MFQPHVARFPLISCGSSLGVSASRHTPHSPILFMQAAWKPAQPWGPPHGPSKLSLRCRYRTIGPFVVHVTCIRSLYIFWTSFDISKHSLNIGTSTSSISQCLDVRVCLWNFFSNIFYMKLLHYYRPGNIILNIIK